MTRTAAIERATGVAWDDWSAWLSDHGAARGTHAEIARLALSRVHELELRRHAATGEPLNDGWWAQSIAIAFEHQHGLRAAGEDHRGKFQASASKTIPADLDEALRRWEIVMAGRSEVGGVALADPPTTSSTEKWRYWRVKFTDGTRAQVDISRRTTTGSVTKSVLAVQHSDLADAEAVASWKAIWKSILAEL